MHKPSDPRQLAIDLLPRSICSVQVAAVLVDHEGRIFAWGWNSVGKGLGEHAEAAAFRRAPKRRLPYATLYVAAKRKGRIVLSRPCKDCERLVRVWGIRTVWYRTGGEWSREEWL